MISMAKGALLAGMLVLTGCAIPPRPEPSWEACVNAFQLYDYYAQAFQSDSYSAALGRNVSNPNVSRQISVLRQRQCITMSDDLTGMEALGARLGPRQQPVESGTPIDPAAVHVGVLTSLSDVSRASAFFAALGYKTRSIGAEQLGRRLYIGPVTTQGGLDAAIATAQEAGFIAPYVSKTFRFWSW